MRPLLVLILVIAAMGGFWLAFNAGEEDSTDGSGLNPGENPVTDVQPKDGANPSELVPSTAGNNTRATEEGPALVAPTPVEPGAGIIGTSVYGRVLDPDGNPIADAEVLLTRAGIFGLPFLEEADNGADDPMVKTNAEGRYQFSDIEAYEAYAVVARHPQFGRAEELDINVIEGDPVQVDIQMGGGVRLYGVVTDGSGGGVANANVSISLTALGALSSKDPNAVRTTTDAGGNYEFQSLANGNYVLTVGAEGYGTVSYQQMNMMGSEDVEKNVSLQIAQMIGGRVESVTGEPVVGALVQAYALARGKDTTRTQTTTDDSGDFIIQDIPIGSYTLMVRADAYGHAREPRVDAGNMSVIIRLTPNPTVSGTVIDARTNQPLRRFKVQLRQEVSGSGVSAPIKDSAMEVSDDQGRFKITCPGKGEYMVEASSAGHPANYSQPFSVTESQNLDGITVRMQTGGQISGRVVDVQGRPVSGASVTSRDTTWSDDAFMRSLGDQYPTHSSKVKTRTNSDGVFTLRPLTPATYLVEVKHKDFATKFQRDIIVTEGQEVKTGDLAMTRGATIEGIVNGPSGKPLPGARVQLVMDTLSATQFPTNYSAKTNKDGKYVVKHVKAGTYSVHARRPQNMNQGNPFQASVDVKNTTRKVTVDEGGTHTGIDFTLGN
ncbi:MAG: carboxypeptidase regulatory-like domain-containing protein [bacterium]|nr:carboxypeptidase regulatory-like domain-containing protein [bacterium]